MDWMVEIGKHTQNLSEFIGAPAVMELSAVERTAEDAAVSKLRAAEQGHCIECNQSSWSTALLRSLTNGGESVCHKLEPALARGTAARALCINRSVQNFPMLTSSRSCSTGLQLLCLGSGLDSIVLSELAGRSNSPYTRLIDADSPAVASLKASRASQHFTGSGSCTALSLSETWHDRSGRYTLVACDLTDEGSLQQHLQPHLDRSMPTLVILECVLVYLLPVHAEGLLQWLSSTLAGTLGSSAVVLYEMLTSPGGESEQREMVDTFGGTMEANLQQRGISLHALKTLEAQEYRLQRNGWRATVAFDMNRGWQQVLTRAERRQSERAEPLDEQEEFVLLMRHYCIAAASGSAELVRRLFLPEGTPDSPGMNL